MATRRKTATPRPAVLGFDTEASQLPVEKVIPSDEEKSPTQEEPKEENKLQKPVVPVEPIPVVTKSSEKKPILKPKRLKHPRNISKFSARKGV